LDSCLMSKIMQNQYFLLQIADAFNETRVEERLSKQGM